MFTGLIEEIGKLKSIIFRENGAVISIECSKVLSDIDLGDSIALDGVCQTVTKIGRNFFEAVASEETLNITNFRLYKAEQKINLERALQLNTRLGGHIVTGHVDGTGKFLRCENKGMYYNFHFSATENLLKYMVYKGSVCINGISLTIADMRNEIFSVAVIPATFKETNLQFLREGENINIETDILAKYVEKFFAGGNNKTGNITENYLKEQGFY